MKPLEGIKVIDLSQFAAAPLVGRIMAEWGADVIKVETAAGDSNRRNGAMCKVPIVGPDENPAFDVTNMFKKFVCINLKSEEGKVILDKMLKTADVLILNFREGSAKRLGIDWETIHAKYPQIVYVRSTGFGDQGPMKDVGGFDLTAYGARGGVMASLGQAGESPTNLVPCFGDLPMAMANACGALAALIKQRQTGIGDRVVGNLLNMALFSLSWAIQGVEGGCEYPVSRKEPTTPTANSYPTKNGKWVQLAGPTYGEFYNRLMRLIGREDLQDHPKYSNWDTIKNEGLCGEVRQIIETQMLLKDAEEWEALFEADDYPCQRMYTPADIVEDPQAWACGALQSVKYPSGNSHLHVALPMRLDSVGMPSFEGATAKRIGHDTRAVLREYGYSDAEIDALAEQKVIVD